MLSTAEAARILGVNESRVRALIKAGRITAQKVGGAWVIQERALERVKVRKPGWPKGKKRARES